MSVVEKIRCTLPNPYSENDPRGELASFCNSDEITTLLTGGGFQVRDAGSGGAELMTGPVSITLYDVILPEGWTTRSHYNTYIVDAKGNWRGRVWETTLGTPIKTELFCRYSMLLPFASNYNLPLKSRNGYTLEVIADRSKISAECPDTFLEGAILWSRYREKQEGLISPKELREVTRRLKQAREKEDSFQWPKRDPWIWIAREYPEWENPFAYW